MKSLLLVLLQLVVSVPALPTGAPAQPFVLDLSGGLGVPGQVIGSVDQSGNIHTPLNAVQVQPDRVDLSPPPAPVDTFGINQVDPVPTSGPEVLPIDPTPTELPRVPLPIPVDPIYLPPSTNVPVDPVPQILPADPNYPQPSNNVPVDPIPSNVPLDPNYLPPNTVFVDPVPQILPADPNYLQPSNNVLVDPIPSNVPLDSNYLPPNTVFVDPVSQILPVDPNYPQPSNNVSVEIVTSNVPLDTNYLPPNTDFVDPVPQIMPVDPTYPQPSNNVPVEIVTSNIPLNTNYPQPSNNAPVWTDPNQPLPQANSGLQSVPNNVDYPALRTIDQGGLNPPSSPNAIDWSCHQDYRPHPSNPNMYQVFFNRQWADYSCFGILTWDQTRCSCIVPPDTGVVDLNCPNNRAHPTDNTRYHIKHWGVWLDQSKQCPVHQLWNQTGCRCDWDPIGPGAVVDIPVGGICDLMFNASFTSDLRDDANYNAIGRDPWFNVKVENGTARLDNGRMPVWAFASNDFGRDFQVQSRIKLDNIPSNTNLHSTIVSNDCDYDRPSVSVSYRPFDQNYRVFFRDQYSNSTLQCNAPSLTPYAYQSVSLEYQSSRLSLKVNGAVCLESHTFGGEMAISRCPFFFGGDGRQQYMTGNLDDVIVRRFCVEAV